MSLEIGIVGLPNVGKSTLFNALLKKQQALVANYPFATIEPNIGIVPVPDERLVVLARITKEEEKMDGLPPIKPATVEFVDIAGLVRGASEGAGLGNKFLSHIREVSVICHVVRAFEDPDIVREVSVDPRSDYKSIETELMLADLQTVQGIKSRIKRNASEAEKSALEKLANGVSEGIAVRNIELTDEEGIFARQWFLLSDKPEIVVLNIAEDDYVEKNIAGIIYRYAQLIGLPQEVFVVISAKIESDIANFLENEQREYLETLELSESGLERLIKKAYDKLNLISFLTCGEKEVRAWTITRGTRAVGAAGVIHTDFSQKFIKAEVISYADFVRVGGWKKAREAGKVRLEGREYVMEDGDLVEFKIGS
jgi:GTP-binding protein YchF